MNNIVSKGLTGLVILIVFSLFSCERSIDNIKDYYKYINTLENGLVKIKNIGALSFSMKYIPSDFYVYKALKKQATVSKDSLKEAYGNNVNFILKIAPSEDAETKFDVMTETVSSLAEFQEQAYTINFDLQEYIHLKAGEQEVHPVLVEIENVYGLAKHRLVNIVFAKEAINEAWQSQDKLDLTFNDEIYGTGKHHFIFYKKDIDNIPQLSLAKQN